MFMHVIATGGSNVRDWCVCSSGMGDCRSHVLNINFSVEVNMYSENVTSYW